MGNAPMRDMSAKLLQRIPYFAHLTDEQLEHLASMTTLKDYAAGQVVVTEDSPCPSFFAVMDGVVKLYVGMGGGGESEISTKGPLTYFNEQALVQPDAACKFTARVVERATLLVLHHRALNASEEWMKTLKLKFYVNKVDCQFADLGKIPFLNNLPPEKLKLLTSLFTYVLKEKGEVICREGEAGDGFYFITQGVCRVTATGQQTKAAFARRVRHSGFLTKRGEKVKSWKRRFFMLEGNELRYYQSEQEALLGMDPRGAVRVVGPKAWMGKPNGIQIGPLDGDVHAGSGGAKAAAASSAGGGRMFYVYGVDAEDSKQWLSLLKAAAEQGAGEESSPSTERGSDRGGAGDRKSTRRKHVRESSMTASAKPGAEHEFQVDLGKGSYFGEVSLSADVPCTATVSAIERCTLLQLPRSDFQNFLSLVPELRDRLKSVLQMRSIDSLKAIKVPFIAEMDDRRLALLSALSTTSSHDPGDGPIIREGDAADACVILSLSLSLSLPLLLNPCLTPLTPSPPLHSFYILVHGRVNITAGGNLLAQLGPGSYFGEIALISDKPRAATVEAATSCLLMSFCKDNFMRLFAYQTPEAMADFTLKVMQKRSELKHVLAHPTGLRLFTKQLESEYSRENVDVSPLSTYVVVCCYLFCCCCLLYTHPLHCYLRTYVRTHPPAVLDRGR